MTYFGTVFGEFGYLNSSCIGKISIFLFLSSSRDKFTLLQQNSVTYVSVGFRPPRWSPSGSDSSSVVFIEHTAGRELVEHGMMGREKGRRRLGNPVFKMADRLIAEDR